jgi:hypothetical protein
MATYDYGWYGDTLLIHLEDRHEFFQFCNGEQRLAVSSLLRHLGTLFLDCEWRFGEPEEFFECAQSWSKD